MFKYSSLSRTLPGLLATITLIVAPIQPAIAQQAPEHPRPASLAEPAEEPAEVTLASLLHEVLVASPELLAAGSRVAAANERPEQAGSLPDPSAGLVFRNVGFPDVTLGDQMMTVLGVRFSQPLPGRGKRPQRRVVAERGIDVATADLESRRRRLLQEVTTAFYDLGFVHQAIGIVGETRDLLLDLEETAEARYAVGEGIQQDVLKGQVEISILLNQLVQLGQERDSLEARINRLIGRPAASPMGRPVAPVIDAQLPPMDTITAEAAADSAVLAARRQRILQQEEAVQLARLDKRPDFVLSGSYMNRGGLAGIWEVNVGVTLPIRKSQRQDRAIEENLQELQARRSDRLDAAQAVDFSVRDGYLRADRADRLTQLFRDAVIPQAVLSLESALAGYGVGKVDFLTVLDNVVTLLTYRLEVEREHANYAKALAQIEEHVGHSLGVTPADVWVPPARPVESSAPTAVQAPPLSLPAIGAPQTLPLAEEATNNGGRR